MVLAVCMDPAFDCLLHENCATNNKGSCLFEFISCGFQAACPGRLQSHHSDLTPSKAARRDAP